MELSCLSGPLQAVGVLDPCLGLVLPTLTMTDYRHCSKHLTVDPLHSILVGEQQATHEPPILVHKGCNKLETSHYFLKTDSTTMGCPHGSGASSSGQMRDASAPQTIPVCDA